MPCWSHSAARFRKSGIFCGIAYAQAKHGKDKLWQGKFADKLACVQAYVSYGHSAKAQGLCGNNRCFQGYACFVGAHNDSVHITHDQIKVLSLFPAGKGHAVVVCTKDQKDRSCGYVGLVAAKMRNAFATLFAAHGDNGDKLKIHPIGCCLHCVHDACKVRFGNGLACVRANGAVTGEAVKNWIFHTHKPVWGKGPYMEGEQSAAA